MTSQQQADLLLACWQAMPETPPAERMSRIDFIRRSMPRPEANDNDTREQAAAREATALASQKGNANG